MIAPPRDSKSTPWICNDPEEGSVPTPEERISVINEPSRPKDAVPWATCEGNQGDEAGRMGNEDIGDDDEENTKSELIKPDLLGLEAERVEMRQDDVQFVDVDCLGGRWEEVLKQEWEKNQCLIWLLDLEAFVRKLFKEAKERRGLCFFTHKQGDFSWRCVAPIGQLDPSVPRFIELWEAPPTDEEGDLLRIKTLQLHLWRALLKYATGFFVGAHPFTRRTQVALMGIWQHLTSAHLSNKNIAVGVSVGQVKTAHLPKKKKKSAHVCHRCLRCVLCCHQIWPMMFSLNPVLNHPSPFLRRGRI